MVYVIYLGKLTKEQIKAGYAALKKIESCVNSSSFGQALIQACDEFYTRIPHSFGSVSCSSHCARSVLRLVATTCIQVPVYRVSDKMWILLVLLA